MDTDQNLAFAVDALQAGLIDASQFVEACTLWSTQRNQSLADLLIERGWIRPADRLELESAAGDAANKRASDATAWLPVTPANIRNSEAIVGDGNRPVALAASGNGTAAPPDFTAAERYLLDSVHATGGMGRVWLARDMSFGRDVALKELLPEIAADVVIRARFLREARITGQLEHPGIVPVYELGHHPDNPFYTMRFVKGRTLTEACQDFHRKRREGSAGPLELVSLLTSFVAVCNTVAYAHSRGVIHRDLKGANVVLGDFGEVIVLDWGLAKELALVDEFAPAQPTPTPASAAHTIMGDVVGTPAYMSPEQASGRIDLVDRRSDIYGLGAILYELLSGQPPFSGGDTREVLTRVVTGTPPRPSELWPEVPQALEAACLRALAREPEDRFQSATALAEEVQHWQEWQRRQAEEALREQTEVLQLILNGMSEAVLVADETGAIQLRNPAAVRLLDIQPEDERLADVARRRRPYFADKVTPYPSEDTPLARAIRGIPVDDVEVFVRQPDREDGIWVSVSGRPLKDEQGALRGGVIVFHDITERKLAEEALRRSRERFELAVAGSQDGLWDWDLLTNEVYFSPRWKEIIGYQDHEIAHHLDEWDKRLHPEERERVLAANFAHINGTTPYYAYEYRLRHKDGSYRWILARGVALRDAAGKAYRMAGSHVDVTERMEAERAARETQECYQAVMAALPVGIVVIDGAGNIRRLNSTAERLVGPEAQRDCPFCPGNVVRADGTPFPMEEQPVQVALRIGQSVTGVVMGLRGLGGEVRWVQASAQALSCGDSGAPAGVVLVLEEIQRP
jgi:PAS domain S-box-containing protein